MARDRAGSGFLILRPPPRKRYILTCSRCGMPFEQHEDTLGEIQRRHFMRWHDSAKFAFTLLDRWKNETRVLS